MRRLTAPLAACAAGATLVAGFFLMAYVVGDHRYPLGWDSPFYVWRAEAVSLDGLDRVGAIRSAGPVLMAAVERLTGSGTLTVAIVAPPVFAAAAGLAAAGAARAAVGVSAAWVPVIAALTWLGFGHPGMVREQPDNVLNAALVLGALAAALGRVWRGRGALASAVLWTAAGIAHWPFYVVAVVAFTGGIVLDASRRDGGQWRIPRLGGDAGVLLGAAGASAAVVAASAFLRAPGAWAAPAFGELRETLRRRFLDRLAETFRWWAYPVAALGAAFTARAPVEPSRARARALLLSVAASWLVVTALGAAAQAAGVPTAGIRLLNFLFPVTLLAGIATWGAARWASSRAGRGGALVAAAVVAASLGGFGAMAWSYERGGAPWYEADAVAQVSAAASWLDEHATALGDGRIRFPIQIPERPDDRLTLVRWRNTVLAILPARWAARADVLVAPASNPLGGPDPDAAATVAVRRYNPLGYAELSGSPERGQGRVAPGVAVASGARRLDAEPVEPSPPPAADTRAATLGLVAAVGLALAWTAGGGWAMRLIPADALLRTALAPALGLAASSLAALAWDAVGLPLRDWWVLVPMALAAGAGWALGVRAVARERAP